MPQEIHAATAMRSFGAAVAKRDKLWAITALTALGGLLRFLPGVGREHVVGLGGLFAQFIDTSAACFPCYPVTIPYYHPGGLPFAYPPLAFFIAAALKNATEVHTTTLLRVLPPLFSTVSIPLFYLASREMLSGSWERIVATGVVALTPTLYRNEVTGGGTTCTGLHFSYGRAVFRTPACQMPS